MPLRNTVLLCAAMNPIPYSFDTVMLRNSGASRKYRFACSVEIIQNRIPTVLLEAIFTYLCVLKNNVSDEIESKKTLCPSV